MEAATQPEPRKLTVAEAAKYFGKTERRIQQWCQDGWFLAFNCTVIRERCGRWIIVIPD
jgi:hypothetical protein